MSAKILVTGFKPFQNEAINPSEILLAELAKVFSADEVETLALPVSYENSFSVLKNHWQAHGPYKALVMLGQAGGRPAVSLERVALNWCESGADEDGQVPHQGLLIPGAPTSYISDFFAKDWVKNLNEIAPTAVSHSAGTYVCNSLYFKMHHELRNTPVPTLFIHVPYLPEQTLQKPNTPSMPLTQQTQILTHLIKRYLLPFNE
jgi:pyroglutamyl-peptidase